MRGKQGRVGIFFPIPRITPADAGKTLPTLIADVLPRDHPRGCGENSNSYNLHDVAWGSPPRMRGKLLCGA